MHTHMLRTFVVAASTGSVAETAKKLRYCESTVLYHIREVEKICRTQLFERQTRGLNLTRKGRVALDISQQLLRRVSELESLHSRPAAGASGRTVRRVGGNLASRRMAGSSVGLVLGTGKQLLADQIERSE